MSFRQRLRHLRRPGFIRSVTVLVGGTAFAQALMVLALPVLTRLYTPRDLSILAVYAALLGIISVAVCLRLDIAIPLPESDTDGANLLASALSSTIVISVVVAIVSVAAPHHIARLLRTPEISSHLWLLPIGVFFAGCSSALQFWATRKRAFARIARAKIEQSVGGVSVQIGLGWLGITPIGLVIGQVIHSGAGFFGLGRKALIEDKVALQSISIADMQRLVREYDRFLKFSIFDSLANVASIQLPVLLIAAQAAGPEAGFLLLAMRVMQAPMGLIGGAISQVYLSRAPHEYRAGTLIPFTQKVLGGLVKTGLGPLIFAGIIAPNICDSVFGPQWHRAGELVMWMTPWFVLQFLVSPVSMVLHLRNKQHVALSLNILGLVVRLLPIGLASYYGYKRALPEVLAVSSVVFYAAWLVYCLRISGVSFPSMFAERYSKTVVLSWVALGMATKILLLYMYPTGNVVQ